MTQSNAVIRPYAHSDDDKLTRFMVAKAALEPLAIANRSAILHPLVVATWIATSAIVIKVLNWWPDPSLGYWGYLRPLPAFAALALPFIFLIDWYQRPQFEKYSSDALKRVDMVNVEEYYSQSASSGFWIYEFGDTFVGLVAVDASPDALSDDSISSSPRTGKDLDTTRANSESRAAEKKIRKAVNIPTAVIRHFYVAEPYRVANAQDDLIEFVVKHVFNTSSGVERVRITPSPLSHYLSHALRKYGFEVVEQGPKVGILGWTTLTYELSKQNWDAHGIHAS